MSHTGEKPLRFTPSLGSHALFLIFCLAGIGDCTEAEVAVQGEGLLLLDEREGHTDPGSFSELFFLSVLNLSKFYFGTEECL